MGQRRTRPVQSQRPDRPLVTAHRDPPDRPAPGPLGAALDRTLAGMAWVSRAGAWVGGALLFASVALIAVEVVLRKLFTATLHGAHELSAYAFALVVSWGFAYALFQKAHIRIDVVYVRLPRALRIALDLLALLALAALAGLMSWGAWGVLSGSLERGSTANSPLATPLWIPQLLWVVGLVWFALSVAALILRSLVALGERDPESVRRHAGSPTLEDEIRAEAPEAVRGGAGGER